MMPIEIALIALWVLLIIRNRAAILPLFILCIDLVLIDYVQDGFYRFCISAAACFLLSCAAITPNYLRPALLVNGMLCLVGALDELLYNHFAITTAYYALMPYLIIAINAYIAAVLFSRGGLQHVGRNKRPDFLVNRWRIRL